MHGNAEDKINIRQRLNNQLFGRIRTDLQPWQDKGITLQQVERTYCTLFEGGFIDGGFRVQVYPLPPDQEDQGPLTINILSWSTLPLSGSPV